MWLIALPVFAVGAVKLGGDASRLYAEDDEDCPYVADVNPGRGVDYECSSYGGQSRGPAVLVLGIVSVCFGAVSVVAAMRVVGSLSHSRDPAPQAEALAADLAELDALHGRGLLTDEERQKAVDLRLRRS